jgi:hypothetical protein
VVWCGVVWCMNSIQSPPPPPAPGGLGPPQRGRGGGPPHHTTPIGNNSSIYIYIYMSNRPGGHFGNLGSPMGDPGPPNHQNHALCGVWGQMDVRNGSGRLDLLRGTGLGSQNYHLRSKIIIKSMKISKYVCIFDNISEVVLDLSFVS